MDATIASVIDLLVESDPSPGVSISFETSPIGSEADPIRLRDALDTARRKVTAFGADPDVVLAGVTDLGKETSFWSSRTEGLAIYAAEGIDQVVALDFTPRTVTRVGRAFHLVPLLQMLPWTDHLVAALSLKKPRVFKLTRREVEELEVAGMPAGLDEITRFEDGSPTLQSHAAASVGGGRTVAAFHGQGGEPRFLDDMRAHYLKQIDHALIGASVLPLMLAGVDELVAEFRYVAGYPNLISDHISGNFDHATPAEVRERAVRLIDITRHPQRRNDKADLIDHRRPVVEGEADVAEAAVTGRVEALFIDPRADGDVVVTEVWRHGGRIWVESKAAGEESMKALLRY